MQFIPNSPIPPRGIISNLPVSEIVLTPQLKVNHNTANQDSFVCLCRNRAILACLALFVAKAPGILGAGASNPSGPGGVPALKVNIGSK
jgi:hypothetical protein